MLLCYFPKRLFFNYTKAILAQTAAILQNDPKIRTKNALSHEQIREQGKPAEINDATTSPAAYAVMSATDDAAACGDHHSA